MKKLLFLLLLMTSATVHAVPATVVNVNPAYQYRTVYDYVTEYEYHCGVVNNSRGVIERTTNGLFGSYEGTLGTIAGAVIGSQVGGGSGQEIATAVGAIVGNKMGNDVARNHREECRPIPIRRTIPNTVTYISHYNVTVDINGGIYTVRRNHSPAIGSVINVSLDVR
jgi:uncharacterized protein YcfJ